jgi:hypothetical protein
MKYQRGGVSPKSKILRIFEDLKVFSSLRSDDLRDSPAGFSLTLKSGIRKTPLPHIPAAAPSENRSLIQKRLFTQVLPAPFRGQVKTHGDSYFKK